MKIKSVKKLIAWVLSVAMIMTIIPTFGITVAAQDIAAPLDEPKVIETSTKVNTNQEGGIVYTKTSTAKSDGTIDIELSAYTEGTVTSTTAVKPVDIVLVLDVSGSMDEAYEGSTKIAKLKEAVNAFIDQTAENNEGLEDHEKHRISIIKFAGPRYSNDTTTTPTTAEGNGTYTTWSLFFPSTNNYTQVVKSLTAVDADTMGGLKSAVNGLSPNGATAIDKGMILAKAVLDEATGEDRDEVVIVFTDGEPTHGNEFDENVANSAISTANLIKDSDAEIFTICIDDGADSSDTTSDTNRFMHYVSSNYPDAVNINTAGERAEGSDFYMTTSETSDLEDVFTTIGSSIEHSPVIELGSEATVVDTLSPYFDFKDASPEGVMLMVSEYKGGGIWDEPVLASEVGITLTPSFVHDRLTVDGFDFDYNHISEVGREDGDFYGRKLVIRFTVTPNYSAIDGASVDIAGGVLPTNTGFALLNDSVDIPAAEVETPVLNTYQVTYKIEGDFSIDDVSYNRFTGSTVTIDKEPVQEGYEFKGWYMDGVPVEPGHVFTMPEEDVLILGEFEIVNSPVRYEIDGIELNVEKPDTENYDYNDTVAVAEDLVVPGYVFSGWYTDDATVSGNQFTMPAHEVVFYGSFEPDDVDYKIEYYFENIEDETDPSNYEDYTIDEGKTEEKTAKHKTIARAELKTFTGYTLNRDLENTKISGEVTVDENGEGNLVLRLYYKLNRHSITYSYVGGFAPENTSPSALELPTISNVKYGTEIVVLERPEIPGESSYDFLGWTTDSLDEEITPGGTFIMPDKDVHILGSFVKDDDAEYVVQHWLEVSEGNFSKADRDITLYGMPDEWAYINLSNVYAFEGYKLADQDIFEEQYDEQTYNADEFRLEKYIEDGEPEEEIRIYYVRESYNVRYEFVNIPPDSSPELPEEEECKFGEVVEVDQGEINIPGYIFSGWDTEDATVENGEFTMPAKEVVLRGRFSPAVVSWKEEHYLEDPENPGVYILDESPTGDITHHNLTGRTVTVHGGHYHGYTFNPIETNRVNTDNGLPELDENNAVTATVRADGNLAIKFFYDCNGPYKVTYVCENVPSGDIEIPAEDPNVPYGKNIEVAEALSVKGYTFHGWTTTDVTIVGGEFKMPDHNVTLRGRFEPNDVEYEVEYWLRNLEGDEYTKTSVEGVTGAKTAKTGEHVEAEIRTLQGFVHNPDHPLSKIYGHVSVDEDGNGNLVLKVFYDRVTANVSYNYTGPQPEGADELLPETVLNVPYGKEITVAGVPELDGYVFEGWTTHSTAVNDNKFAMPAHDVTFYGRFVKYYDVKYDLKGGTGAEGIDYTDKVVEAGTVIDLKDAPTREGYTFKGWKDESTKYEPYDTVAVEKNMLFVAQWQRNGSGGGGGGTTRYVLTYESNGGTSYKDERYDYGTVVEIDKTPEKEGYIFEGWYGDKTFDEPVDEVKMTKDITVYAKWVEDNGAAGDGHETPDMLNGVDHFAYVVGYPDGNVKPDAHISRAEVTAIFFRLLKAEEVRDKYLTDINYFDDVEIDDWHNISVSTMNKLGIVEGRTSKWFVPDANITRAEFATICARFDDSEFEVKDNFTDISGHWAEEYIHEAAAHGWIRGYENGTFKPDQFITRAEAMTMINRVLNRVPENAEDLLDDMIKWPDNSNTNKWYYLAVQEATNSHDYEMKNSIYERWTSIKEGTDWIKYQ